ncbi:MAG: ribonuclease P protein component [Gammaproteobacteria bacterium]|nr:ribonuclease P protein component [Gammaproteobacteria bacterium]
MTVNSARFLKRARLLKPAEFSRVFKQAIRSSDDQFTILASGNKLAYPRLGLAISKKNAKRAVDRNRIKRLVRESFRQHQSMLPTADFVVMAKPGTKKTSNAVLFDSLEKHWDRLCAKFLSD